MFVQPLCLSKKNVQRRIGSRPVASLDVAPSVHGTARNRERLISRLVSERVDSRFATTFEEWCGYSLTLLTISALPRPSSREGKEGAELPIHAFDGSSLLIASRLSFLPIYSHRIRLRLATTAEVKGTKSAAFSLKFPVTQREFGPK